MNDDTNPTIASRAGSAFRSLLAFVVTTTRARRGTLSIGDVGAATLKADIGFFNPQEAAAFGEARDVTRTLIPLDEHGLIKAIIALAWLPSDTPVDLTEATAELVRHQIPILLEAECLAIDLAEFRRHVASIVDDALEPFISMDKNGIVREWNESAATTFGWSRAEALGKTAAELIVPPELRERHRNGFKYYTRGDTSRVVGQRLTVPAIRRDGSALIVEMRVSASRDGEGQPIYHAFVHDVTAFEETRERLCRSENLLREAQQIAALGSFEHDLITNEVFCSDELLRMLGIESGQLAWSKETLSELVHSDDRIWTCTEYDRAIVERRSHDFEHRAVRVDGQPMVIRRRGYVRTNEHGSAIRVYATVQDITEQRRAEAERRDLESRFTEAFDNAPLGISIISATSTDYGTITRVNRAYCALIGYSPDEIVGKRFTAFITFDDHAAAIDSLRELLTGAVDVTQREVRMIRRDGLRIWVRQTRSLMRDESGAPLCFFTHNEDVTQRRTDQAALSEVHTRLQRSLDDAPIGMALTSCEPASLGKFIEVNPALCRITGLPREVLMTMSFDDLVHPTGRSRSADAMQRLVAGHDTFTTYEERYVRADGAYGWMSVHASLAHDSENRPLYCIAQIVDITKRKEAESRLQHLAYHDALTDVLNRRGLALEVKNRIIDSTAAWGQTALLLLDFDHFKYVNDTMGHATGDRILRKVAKILRQTCHESSIISRLGGDEFLIILIDSNEDAAVTAADDIRRAIASNVSLSEETELYATVSIGIVTVDTWTENTIDEAIAAADVALASAKEQGRNRSNVARSLVSSHTAMREQLTWSQRIRIALERDDFTLYAQPILNLHNGIVERYELLLRLIEEDGSVRLPDEFLPVAERSGLMPEIDCWVVGRAIDIAAAQQRTGRPVVFEVNLSGASLTNERVTARIEQGLRSQALDPRALVFEITETAAIGKMEQACTFAEKIAALGCAFALDDFGAGFSSFYYLKYLPFSDLKIDGEFIRGLTHSASDQLIVRAIVDLARGLGKATIAEFVGDAETALLLQNYGVDFAQGYYIGRPLPWATLGEPAAESVVGRERGPG